MIDLIILNLSLTMTFPIGKLVLQVVKPIFFTGVRMMISGSILLIFSYIRYHENFWTYIQRKYVRLWLILTVFNIYFTNVLDFWALQFLPVSKAAFLYSITPFFAAFLSYIVFGEKMTLKKWFGLALAIAGFILLLQHKAPGEIDMGDTFFFFIRWPELAVLGAAFATAYGWVSMRQLAKDSNYPVPLG